MSNEAAMKAELDGSFRKYDPIEGYKTVTVPKHWWPGCEKTLRDLRRDEEMEIREVKAHERNVLMERKRMRTAMKLAVAQSTPKPVTMEAALSAVLSAWGVTVSQFVGPRRDRRIVWARSHFAWLIRIQRPDLSLAAIGRFMKRDHSTVLTASGRFAERPVHSKIERVNDELGIERATAGSKEQDRDVAPGAGPADL
jgi:chromosomal replication initiation ATPase DnaA